MENQDSSFTSGILKEQEAIRQAKEDGEAKALLHRLLGGPASSKKKPDNIYFVSGPC